MAVTTRDVLLVLRAKDEASTTIRGIGTAFGTLGTDAYNSAARMIAAGGALVGLGAAMTGAGLGLLALTEKMVSASLAYQQQAALTFTQVDQLGTSLNDVKDIGFRVAQTVPVPFEQVQQGLYDVFSSMDVTAYEAEQVLTAFAKGAVAGQTDIQSAGRATIGILNAYGYGIEELNRVQDVQFQLVRKGVGTYADFAGSIGMVLPAAARSGQEIENVSGMLAFLTRNSLSASTASTSAARALELLTNPKVVERMEAMGIVVRDNQGQFQDITVIATQLGQAMEGMTDPERAEVLNDLFKGAGNNIQARRFWDLATRNYDELNQRVLEMHDSAGAAEAAYEIMFNQPQSQIDLLMNKLDIFKTMLGDELMPTLEELMGPAQAFLDWLIALSPETKEMIAQGIALAGVLLTVTGVLMGFAGAFLIFAGAIKMAGGLMALVGIFAKFFAILALIGLAAFLIWKNWDKILPLWEKFWPKLKEAASRFWDWLISTWEEIWPKLRAALESFWGWLQDTWEEYWPRLRDALERFWSWLVSTWEENWPKIKQFLIDTFNSLKDYWNEYWPKFREKLQEVWDWIQANWPTIKQTFIDVFDAIVSAITYVREHWDEWWNAIKEFWADLRDNFGPGVIEVFNAIREHLIPIIVGIKDIIVALWPIFAATAGVIKVMWDQIASFFENGMQILRGVVDFIAGVLTGDWQRAWDGIKNIVSGFVDGITDMIQNMVNMLFVILKIGWEIIKMGWKLFWQGVKDLAQEAVLFLETLPGRIVGIFIGLIGSLFNIGKAIMRGLKSGLQAGWEEVKDFLGHLNPAQWKGPPARDAKMLVGAGNLMMNGLQSGLAQGWRNVAGYLQSLDPAVVFGVHSLESIGANVAAAGVATSGGSSTTITIEQGAVQVSVGDVRGEDDIDQIEQVVNNAFNRLVFEMNQPTYGGR